MSARQLIVSMRTERTNDFNTRSVHEDALQLFAEVLTRPGEPRTSQCRNHAERRRDFFVAQSIDFPEDENRSLIEWQLVQCLPDVPHRLVLLGGLIGFGEWPHVRQIAVRGDVFVERHLLRLMAPAPPAAAIGRLRDDHAINPRP